MAQMGLPGSAHAQIMEKFNNLLSEIIVKGKENEKKELQIFDIMHKFPETKIDSIRTEKDKEMDKLIEKEFN